MTPKKLNKLLTRIFGPRHDVQAADLFGCTSRAIQYYKTGERKIPEKIIDIEPDLEFLAVAIDVLKNKLK